MIPPLDSRLKIDLWNRQYHANPRLQRLSWGKYLGYTISSIPMQYIHWTIQNHEDPAVRQQFIDEMIDRELPAPDSE
ncbi:hypothetical protein UFOVP109_23 [uncultured Caudovirales phage]|uniref:Uncharacterized protein n=1 Tax=uncultured Caudovirales phage TaxID=2100421 RepID=A0A6J5L479_9CAUD|nr:hypothetical protein UFOVP109_23 [uncultured Caudovirales phage]CAB5218864.1 hypothetical protein UFOVP224_3 [uncultured Caudovirales phage]